MAEAHMAPHLNPGRLYPGKPASAQAAASADGSGVKIMAKASVQAIALKAGASTGPPRLVIEVADPEAEIRRIAQAVPAARS
jgi:hypothetical protein